MVIEKQAERDGTKGSLFKKRRVAGFKKAKARGRIQSRRQDSDDDDKETSDRNNDEGESAMDAIVAAKKKRKLLNSVLGKSRRGLDTALLMQPKAAAETDDDATGVPAANKDLSRRLKGNFSEGGETGDGSGDTAMQRKHKDAMEEFIMKSMKTKTSNDESSGQGNAEKKSTTKSRDLEAQLYEELASSAMKLSGQAANDDTHLNAPQEQEGDVGAGGAMLGGTGIAEVALDLDSRMNTLQATQQAVAARERTRRDEFPSPSQHAVMEPEQIHEQMLPVSFSVGKGKRGKQTPVVSAFVPTITKPLDTQTAKSNAGGPTASSAGVDVLSSDVSGLGSSVSQNYRLHNQEWISQKKEQQGNESEMARQQEIEDVGTAANQERLGFEAARRIARGEPASDATSTRGRDGNPHGDRHRSNDDRAFKNFIQKTRR